jgi:hypothetical protein
MTTPDLNAQPGDPGADSYITLQESDAMAALIGLTAWLAADEEKKKAALRRAAMDIDTHRFHDAEAAVSGQARVFPRRRDGISIPAAVKWAALFQAEYLLSLGKYVPAFLEGPAGAPMKDARVGSALCTAAFRTLARLFSRSGRYCPPDYGWSA